MSVETVDVTDLIKPDEGYDYDPLGHVTITISDPDAKLDDVLAGLNGYPLMLDVPNRPAMVLINLQEYRKLLELAEAYEITRLAKQAIEDVKAGRVMTVEEFRAKQAVRIAELEAKLAKEQAA